MSNLESHFPGEFTELLDSSRGGNEKAWSELIRLVYADLRRMARHHLHEQDAPWTLNTTGLVHESYLRLVGTTQASVENRRHFFALASRIMRQVMCDYARARLAAKRGAGQRGETMDELSDPVEESEAEAMLLIDEALKTFEESHPSWARIIECRFFAGLSEDETAEALGLPLRRIQRDWRDAKHWLEAQLQR